MSRRYDYTPRRSGRQQGRGLPSLAPIWIPIVVVVAIAGLVWFATRGGDECAGNDCERALALGGTQSPVAAGQSATPGPEPRLTPRRSPIAGPAPTITGLAAAVLELPCAAALYELNAGSRLAPASLTKIMTALVTADEGDFAAVIPITIDGGELSLATDATVMGIKPGQQLSLKDLLYGLLLRSGNDAALMIAEHIADDESAFVDLMNAKARALGLSDTHFANPHGLDAVGHYTSAYDIAVMGATLLADPRLAEIVSARTYQPNWDGGELQNLNLLLNDFPGAIGVKTGYTDQAGATIVGAAELDGRVLIVSVLHSDDLYVDAAKLLEWAFQSTAPACSGDRPTGSAAR